MADLGLTVTPVQPDSTCTNIEGHPLWTTKGGRRVVDGIDDAGRFFADIDLFQATCVEVTAEARFSEWTARRYLDEDDYGPDFRRSYFNPRAGGAFPMPDRDPEDYFIRPLVAFWQMEGLVGERMVVEHNMHAWPAAFHIRFEQHGGTLRTGTTIVGVSRRPTSLRSTGEAPDRDRPRARNASPCRAVARIALQFGGKAATSAIPRKLFVATNIDGAGTSLRSTGEAPDRDRRRELGTRALAGSAVSSSRIRRLLGFADVSDGKSWRPRPKARRLRTSLGTTTMATGRRRWSRVDARTRCAWRWDREGWAARARTVVALRRRTARVARARTAIRRARTLSCEAFALRASRLRGARLLQPTIVSAWLLPAIVAALLPAIVAAWRRCCARLLRSATVIAWLLPAIVAAWLWPAIFVAWRRCRAPWLRPVEIVATVVALLRRSPRDRASWL